MDHDKEYEYLVSAAAGSIERLVNGGGKEYRVELVNKLGSMHRTLQQSVIGDIVIPLVRDMASRLKNGNFDGRNEYAVKACDAMLEGLAEKFPYVASGECRLPLV